MHQTLMVREEVHLITDSNEQTTLGVEDRNNAYLFFSGYSKLVTGDKTAHLLQGKTYELFSQHDLTKMLL